VAQPTRLKPSQPSRRLGLTDVASDIRESENTSAASIPIAITRVLEQHAALSGHLALLLSFGAGLGYAGQVVRLR
jgi:3-oxoacyl-[acyl-carrier-protein] synthase III